MAVAEPVTEHATPWIIPGSNGLLQFGTGYTTRVAHQPPTHWEFTPLPCKGTRGEPLTSKPSHIQCGGGNQDSAYSAVP